MRLILGSTPAQQTPAPAPVDNTPKNPWAQLFGSGGILGSLFGGDGQQQQGGGTGTIDQRPANIQALVSMLDPKQGQPGNAPPLFGSLNATQGPKGLGGY